MKSWVVAADMSQRLLAGAIRFEVRTFESGRVEDRTSGRGPVRDTAVAVATS